MKFSIKDFRKYDQICRKLRISSQTLKKFLLENFIFCAVWVAGVDCRKVCLCSGNVEDTKEGVSSTNSSLIQKIYDIGELMEEKSRVYTDHQKYIILRNHSQARNMSSKKLWNTGVTAPAKRALVRLLCLHSQKRWLSLYLLYLILECW